MNPAEMPYASTFEKANIMSQRLKQGIGAPIKQSLDVQDRIEKMFNLIEEKTSNMTLSKQQKHKTTMQSASIVSDSIERSVFGVFSKNYKRYKDMPGKKDNMEIWKYFFITSKIMNDVQRCLLYFNLPFDDIIKEEIKPMLLFE